MTTLSDADWTLPFEAARLMFKMGVRIEARWADNYAARAIIDDPDHFERAATHPESFQYRLAHRQAADRAGGAA